MTQQTKKELYSIKVATEISDEIFNFIVKSNEYIDIEKIVVFDLIENIKNKEIVGLIGAVPTEKYYAIKLNNGKITQLPKELRTEISLCFTDYSTIPLVNSFIESIKKSKYEKKNIKSNEIITYVYSDSELNKYLQNFNFTYIGKKPFIMPNEREKNIYTLKL